MIARHRAPSTPQTRGKLPIGSMALARPVSWVIINAGPLVARVRVLLAQGPGSLRWSMMNRAGEEIGGIWNIYRYGPSVRRLSRYLTRVGAHSRNMIGRHVRPGDPN